LAKPELQIPVFSISDLSALVSRRKDGVLPLRMNGLVQLSPNVFPSIPVVSAAIPRTP
jgi:hypothetical protein